MGRRFYTDAGNFLCRCGMESKCDFGAETAVGRPDLPGVEEELWLEVHKIQWVEILFFDPAENDFIMKHTVLHLYFPLAAGAEAVP